MSTKGFFVDWDGNTRRTEDPGDHLKCVVNLEKQDVDVVASDGLVVYECTYFPTLEAVEAAGVTIKLI